MRYQGPSSTMPDAEYERYRQLRRDKKDCEERVDSLRADCEAQSRSVAQTVSTVFTHRSTAWFVRAAPRSFLFHCILPRILASDIDAKFGAKFVELAMRWSVPHFYAMDFAGVWLENLNQILSSSTHSEARRCGRFMNDFMSILERYRRDKGAFKRELSGVEAVKRWDSETQTAAAMDHEDFCTAFRSMHRSLTIYFCHLMQSQNLLWQKNAILVLHEVSSVYPTVESHAKHLKTKVAEMLAVAQRGSSMAILCQRIIDVLQQNMERKDVFINERKFGGRDIAQSQNEKEKGHQNDKKAATSTTTTNESQSASESLQKLNELKQQALATMNKAKHKTVSGQKRSYSEIGDGAESKGRAVSSKRSRLDHDRESDGDRDRERDRDRSKNRERGKGTKRRSRDRDSDSGRSSRDRSRDRSKTRGGSNGKDRERESERDRRDRNRMESTKDRAAGGSGSGGSYDRDRSDRGDRENRENRGDRSDRGERYNERGSRERDGNRGDREHRDRSRVRGGGNKTWRMKERKDRDREREKEEASNRGKDREDGDGDGDGKRKSNSRSRERETKKAADSNEDKRDRDRERERPEKDRKRSRRRDDRR